MSDFTNFMSGINNANLEENLPLFRELKINFDTGEVETEIAVEALEPNMSLTNVGICEMILCVDKNIYSDVYKQKTAVGIEGLKIWIWNALKTERFKYIGHSTDYGNSLHEEIGYVYNRTVKEQLLYQEIYNCLMVNPYILNVYGFEAYTNLDDYSNIKINFNVSTIYGDTQHSTEMVNI